MGNFDPQMTIEKAREVLFEIAVKEGVICPVCDKHVKIYNRKFNSGMARTLIYIYHICERHPGKWLDVLRYCAKSFDYVSGEHAKLIWWGLLERKPGAPDDGAKSVSKYRITESGRCFAGGEIQIPARAVEYRSDVLDWSEEYISIQDALGRKFNYQELMRTPGNV